MLQPEQIQTAVIGKVTCDINSAASLLNHIVQQRIKGARPRDLKPTIAAYAANHDIGESDVNFIKQQAEELAVANGARPAPVFISAVELFHKEIEPTKWIVPGMIAAGLTILAGRPKRGKSWLALDLAIAAASGGALFDELDCEGPCDVLYLALEDSESRIKKRMKQLTGGEEPPKRLTYSTEWSPTDKGGLDDLIDWIESRDKPGLIIVDTLQKVRPASKRGVGIYESDYGTITPLKKLADKYKVSIVLVHHVRKAKSKDPQEMISGSYGLTGAADTNIVLDRDPATKNGSLHIVGRDVGETDFALLFDQDIGRWSLLGECQLPATQLQQDILAAIKSKSKSPAEIAEAVGSSLQVVKNTLGKMVKKEIVMKPEYGKYISATYELEQQL